MKNIFFFNEIKVLENIRLESETDFYIIAMVRFFGHEDPIAKGRPQIFGAVSGGRTVRDAENFNSKWCPF